ESRQPLKRKKRPRLLPGALFNSLPAVVLPGLFGGHGEVAVIGGGAAVAPGGVDVVVRAVQGGHGPDVGVVGEGCAVDALQLQQQVVGAGVPVAHGGAVFKQVVCDVAQGAVPGGVIIDAVVADPGEIDPGLLI